MIYYRDGSDNYIFSLAVQFKLCKISAKIFFQNTQVHVTFEKKSIFQILYAFLILADFLKISITKFAVIWVKKRQKAGFLSPRRSKIIVTKEKERRKRKSEEKERRRRNKKAKVALLVFIMATLELLAEKEKLLDAKGLYGDTVIKNLARIKLPTLITAQVVETSDTRGLKHQTFLVPRTPTGSIFAAWQPLRMWRRSWVEVTYFKTRVFRLKLEVQILGCSKSIRQTKVEILSLKSCLLRKKETKLQANLWKTFSNELFCRRSWWFHVGLLDDLHLARKPRLRSSSAPAMPFVNQESLVLKFPTVNNNSPIQGYVHPDNYTQPTNEMTPGFQPFTILPTILSKINLLNKIWLHKSQLLRENVIQINGFLGRKILHLNRQTVSKQIDVLPEFNCTEINVVCAQYNP